MGLATNERYVDRLFSINEGQGPYTAALVDMASGEIIAEVALVPSEAPGVYRQANPLGPASDSADFNVFIYSGSPRGVVEIFSV